MKRLLIGTMLSMSAVAPLMLVGCSHTTRDGVADIPRAPKPPEVPAQRMEPINVAYQESAKKQLRDAMSSPEPRIRANAVEAVQKTLGLSGKDMIVAALDDGDPNVRFAACMAVGKLGMTDQHTKLLAMADDSVAKVRVGVRFALHKIGDTTLSHDLESLAQHPSPRVREDVAFVLGELGEPSGLKLLVQMQPLQSDDGVRTQINESRWKLGDEEALEPISRGLVSNFLDDQMLALIALTGPRDRRVITFVRGKLTDTYDEIRLVAARCMGDLGSDAGYPVAMGSLKDVDPRKRLLAAVALGSIGRSDAQNSLAPLLNDKEQRVRVAAATALLQLQQPANLSNAAVTQTAP